MLLRPHEDGVLAIGQASHAWVSGQLARAWGNERFAAPEPWEQVCLAAEQHDIGMAEWDVRPALNPDTGLPRSFMQFPIEAHIGLWARAPSKVMSQSAYAALLVSMHGTALQATRDLEALDDADRALVTSYVEREQRLQSELIERLEADPEQVRRNQQLVWAWDLISLVACLGWEDTAAEVPARDGATRLEARPAGERRSTVDPWPFGAERLDVICEGRLLAGRFTTETGLHAALDRAPLVTLELALESV